MNNSVISRIIAGGDLAANITGGSISLVTLANDSSTVNATQSLQLQAQGIIGGDYTSDGTLQLASWTGINSSTTATAANITQVWSIGPVAGSFTGTQNIGSIQSYSSIDATINSGNNQTGLPATEGNIQSLQGWGGISGSIAASNNISQIISAGAITASPTTGSGGVIGSIIANDKVITEAMVPVSDLNMAAFAAAMNELSYNLAAAAKQAGLAAGDISQAIASVQSLVSQEASQAQAGNRVALAAAQSQIAEASAAATTQLADAGQAVATAQSQGLGQINQAKANAQTQDQQLNQQMLDELGGALQQASGQSINLSDGLAAGAKTLSAGQAEISQVLAANVQAVKQYAANRPAEWNAAADKLLTNSFVNVLEQGLQDAEQYVAGVAQSFVNTVKGLASLAYVGITDPGQLLNAAGQALVHLNSTLFSIGRGIETWWGNLTSGDPYRAGEATGDLLQQLLPFAGEVRDVQLTGDVLEADGVVARCTEGPGCFLAGTQVITGVNADGTYQTQQIQNIAVGQTVLTKNRNDPNGPLQEETGTAVQVHTVYALRDVTIKNADGSVETIDTTDSHPFYVQGQGWVSADDLTAGETLSTPDGQTATVVGTVTVADPQGVLVYNFTVADDHTYFVEGFGAATNSDGTTGTAAGPLDAVWVHNNCAGSFTVGAEDLAARAKQLLNLAPKAYTRNMTTIAVAVGRNESGEIMTAVASSEARLRSEQMLARSLFENPVEGVDGVHAEVKAVRWLESQGFSQIIGVGASRRICEDCVPQLLARGLELP